MQTMYMARASAAGAVASGIWILARSGTLRECTCAQRWEAVGAIGTVPKVRIWQRRAAQQAACPAARVDHSQSAQSSSLPAGGAFGGDAARAASPGAHLAVRVNGARGAAW